MEEWRDVEGFLGYEVSDQGKVRSYANNRHGPNLKEPHLLRPVKNRHGYDTVCLGRGNRRLVHRLVANAFIPNPDDSPIVRHLDDNPSNNHVGNLVWGTQIDNMQDCVKHGRLVGDTRAAVEATKTSVVATSLYDGHSVIFSSLHEAARELGLWPQHISSVLKRRLRQTGGYTFEYLDEVNE